MNDLEQKGGDFDPRDQYKENSAAATMFIPPDLKTVASDYNSWRLTMVKEIIDNLNTSSTPPKKKTGLV